MLISSSIEKKSTKNIVTADYITPNSVTEEILNKLENHLDCIFIFPANENVVFSDFFYRCLTKHTKTNLTANKLYRNLALYDNIRTRLIPKKMTMILKNI